MDESAGLSGFLIPELSPVPARQEIALFSSSELSTPIPEMNSVALQRNIALNLEESGDRSRLEDMTMTSPYSNISDANIPGSGEQPAVAVTPTSSARGMVATGFPTSSSVGSQLFALIIGINRYKSTEITTLRGAVADALAFQAYFEDDLQVPKSHITLLLNEQATQTDIVEALKGLANNPNIQKDDPIVIFYAGHGIEQKLTANPEVKVQALVPYDFSSESGDHASSIPRSQMENLIENIATNKGDNITVILDCVHSGTTTSLRSHMLLAACGTEELARESNGHGIFSAALLKLLRTHPLHELRYCDILPQMDAVSGQNPQCVGKNQYRSLFTTKDIRPIRGFPVRFTEGSREGLVQATVEAGSAQGVFVDAQFIFYLEEDLVLKNPLGRATIKLVTPFTAISIDDLPKSYLTQRCIAIQSGAGQKESLRLFIPRGDALHALNNSFGGSDSYTLVEEQSMAHLKATVKDGNVVFEMRDKKFPQMILTFNRIAHFFFELNRNNTPEFGTGFFPTEFYELEEDQSHDMWPRGSNLNNNGIIDIVVNPGTSYGLKLINWSPDNFYSYLFMFNYADFSIKDYYFSPGLPNSPYIQDIPLKRFSGTLTIGYGFDGGNEPFRFALKDGQDLNISFLKLILSTKPLDLLDVPQISPFDVDLERSIPQLYPSKLIRFLPNSSPVQRKPVEKFRLKMPEVKQQDEWTTIIIPIIQRRYPEKY